MEAYKPLLERGFSIRITTKVLMAWEKNSMYSEALVTLTVPKAEELPVTFVHQH